MALCLCETRYGLFRTVKTFKWREIVGAQGSPWDGVIAKWETWAGSKADQFEQDPWQYDSSKTESIRCKRFSSGPLLPQSSCLRYNMGKTINIDFGIEPEPKETEPKNVETPPDDVSNELGPYYAGQDPPGNFWDQSPSDWEPTQVVAGCDCVVPRDGDVLSMEDDKVNTDQNPWERFYDSLGNTKDHYEDVEVKFWLSYKRQTKLGFDRVCCDGYGIEGGVYENGWQNSNTGNIREDGAKFYEPEWSGEPTITVAILYGLFYKEYNQLIKMRKRHACL